MILRCSNCLKPLCEIIKGEKPLEEEISVTATCPYCGDKSMPQWFDKKISASPYTVLDNAYPDGYREVTAISNAVFEGNKYRFEIKLCQNQKL